MDGNTPTNIEDLLSFLGIQPSELTLVRVLANPMGRGSADVACAADGDDFAKLLGESAREPYLTNNGWRIYQGTYARLCHRIEPRGWLDRGHVKLTADTATGYPAFVIDVDAVKAERDTPSSDAEQAATRVTTTEIMAWMASVLGDDRSYALHIDSGNGDQTLVRCSIGIEDAALPRVLLLRLAERWPTVDTAGWKLTSGPAMPGTWKKKGNESYQRPHRIVRVRDGYEGDRKLSADDLRRLIDALPPASSASETQSARSTWTTGAYDEFSAVAELPIEDVSLQLFAHRVICPVCKSTDNGVAIVRSNVITCQHRNRCPAAASGKTGFTAVHAIGVKLAHGYGPYTPEQRAEIVQVARELGWELDYDDGETPKQQSELAENIRLIVEALRKGEPPVHCSVRPGERWLLKSKSTRLASDMVYRAIAKAYAPGYVDQRPLVMAGRIHAYHELLGIWVPITTDRTEPTDEPRVRRIVGDQEDSLGIWASDGTKSRSWSPSCKQTLRDLEMLISIPGFFEIGTVGLACRDGFMELRDGRWRRVPHSPKHRARGRIRRHCFQVVHDISGETNQSVKALRDILVRTLRRDDVYVDDVLRLFLEQVGAVICRVQPELRAGIICYGAEDTGKSSLMRIAKAMIHRVGLTVSAASLAEINSNFPPESLLASAANIVEEEGSFDTGHGVRTHRFKQMIEGSPWTFQRKHQSALSVQLQPLMMFASNWEPSFSEATGAISKRSYIIQYPGTPTPKAELDREMVPRFLHDHLDGIIAASLVGAANLQLHGRTSLRDDSEIVAHTQALGRTPPLVEAWLGSETVAESHEPSTDALRNDAHSACVHWGIHHGYREEAETCTPSKFTRAINRQCARKTRESHGRTYSPVSLLGAINPTAAVNPDGKVKI